ncbi:MAG: paraquat-inducible protein A, partial [Acetobacteraceae bacterium]|nr:paraquat-inducible protein A [Acetobacteraceae bacterium]
GRNLDAALACAISTLLLLTTANALPLTSVAGPTGVVRFTYLGSGCAAIWEQGWPLVALVLGLQGIALPLLHFCLLIAALTAVRLKTRPRWVGSVFRYAQHLDLWAMSDVLLLGGIIGYGRVATSIPVHVEPGGWCLIAGALLTMLTRASLDRRAFWRRIEEPPERVFKRSVACLDCNLVLPANLRHCPRCGAHLYRRKPFAQLRTNALVAACFLLLPVANYFPASTLWEGQEAEPHTIFDGIRLLFQTGYAPVGLLVFCTSMAIPLLKLVSLIWFSISMKSRSRRYLRLKTRLYRMINVAGRWSNLDPFTVAVFTPMIQFEPLAHINVGGGAPAFLALIILSMIAVRVFDPRLMWDAAGITSGVR